MDKGYWSLDTETTGIDPKAGHKVIEIGAVKIIDGKPNGETFHVYIDPQREVPLEAVAVHNLTREDVIELGGGRIFESIAQDILHIFKDQVLVAHNAGFDMGFLDHELEELGLPTLSSVCEKVICSLQYARTVYPSGRNTLDALAKKYGVDTSGRDYHGALLDAEILGSVFTAMTTAQKHISLGAVIKSMQSKRYEFTLSDVIKPIDRIVANNSKVMLIDNEVNIEHKKYLSGIDDGLSW